jgi:hypothetical protein
MVSSPATMLAKGPSGGKIASPWINYTKNTPQWILIVENHVTFGQTTGCHHIENLTFLIYSLLPKIKASAAEKPE